MAKGIKLKSEIFELKYNTVKKIFFPRGALSQYSGGLELPSKDNIVKVTAKEREALLRMKNGKINCFVENKTPVKKIEEDK